MNLQQLRYLCGIADHELNISKAAEALHTSQPGVTRQIRQLNQGVPLLRSRDASCAMLKISAAWEQIMPMRTTEL
jgi:DNA-binding transcriptional LysR family regulator